MSSLSWFRAPKTLCLSVLVSAFGLAGCMGDELDAYEVTNLDGDAALSELDPLFDGAPDPSKLADEGKADAVYPAKFDLVATQSPVKSQGRRGVCTIFAATALMEHLYKLEGTLPNPDFSEQFLQWSTKVEVGDYQNTDGSNADTNLDAINRFGITEESAWPYESSGWSTANDPACTKAENLPTKCYTNGDPPASALAATRFHLPRGRWVSPRARSIKAVMNDKKQAVVIGLTFFYQAWNHRAGTLVANNEYWRQGYVTYPNAKDKTESQKSPAGHGILLVGWDDNLTVQKRDGDGNLLTDAQGNPDLEKGFFIFKNSWGTGSFGVANPYGDGYGFISMKYVEEYAGAYVADLPEVKVAEVCNDGIDNDKNGKIDCQDTACSQKAACTGGTATFENTTAQNIPDNDATGISSAITVAQGGSLSAASVTVDITHTYIGDLTVKLVRDGGGEVVLHDKAGGSADNIQKTFSVSAFNGQDMAGTWRLVVSDTAKTDTGKLNRWSLELKTGAKAATSLYESTQAVAIPDDDPTGVKTTISVPDAGSIKALKVRVTIDHAYQGDLTLKLRRASGTVITLQQADGSSGDFGTKTFTPTNWNGVSSAATWSLTAIDEAASDVGTLTGWSLEVTR
ncbi:MAG: proprotein convertase P-domain-containing protein [Polyangiaceae bacterium]|nr:proprotein convertase P-domain-containing protein [Polyangiaceae bacterium]